MSALALIMKNRGFSISGSDQKISQPVLNLKKLGIKIFTEQKASNLDHISQTINQQQIIIVKSSAIAETNQELKAADQKKLKVLHRSDLLNMIINEQESILIAGSHGKTTTSTLITTLLTYDKQDPTAVIGGIVPCLQSNAKAGKGRLLIAEIDESDGSIIKYNGNIGVITNLELDHTDYYNNIELLMESIQIFSSNCRLTLANYDCNNLRICLKKESIWWSIKESKNVDFAGIPLSIDGVKTIAKYYEKGQFIDNIIIPIPGIHNLSNAIAAIAAIRMAGIEFKDIKKNLQFLRAPNRRFEFKGIWEGRQIIDDYAHHPSEIRETISMARLILKSKESILPIQCNRLIGVFQPHRFSRTRDLMNDFGKHLGKVDLLFLAPIYSAGENPIEKVNIETLKSCILNHSPKLKVFTSTKLEELESILINNTKPNDLILIMGAGDITKLSESLQNKDRNRKYKLETNAA